MSDQLPRRRFRLLRWSLFGLALVGLGFLLQEWLSPWPRCTIPFKSSISFGGMSADGHYLVTGNTPASFNAFLGGGLNNLGGMGLGGPGMPRPMVQGGLDNPIQVWDTRSGKLEGTYLKDSRAWMHEITSSFRYMAACDDQPDAGPFDNDFHLVDLQAKNEVRLPLKGSPNYRFSPQETFVLVSEGTEKGNKIFHLMKSATGKIESTFQGAAFHGFVPDESLIVYEAQNGDERDLCIWSTRLQKVVHTLPKVSGE